MMGVIVLLKALRLRPNCAGRSALGVILAGVVLTCVGPLAPHVAWAADTRVQLRLETSDIEQCPSLAELETAVAGCMMTPPADWTCPQASATVAVGNAEKVGNAEVSAKRGRRGSGKPALTGHFTLRVGDRSLGERRLGGRARCTDLVAAAALGICIGLDALCSAPPPKLALRRAKTPSFRGGRRDSVSMLPTPNGPRLSVSVLVSRGAAPSTSAGLSLSASTSTRPLRFALEARLDAPATGPFQGGTIGSSLALGGLSACFDWRDLSLCGVQYAGFKHFFGLGFARDVQVWQSYFGTSVRVAWQFFRRGGFGTVLWIQADVPSFVDNVEVEKDVPGAAPERHRWTTPRVGLTVGLEFVRNAS
jgi:hypothetical protein